MPRTRPTKARRAAIGYETLWHGQKNETGLARKLRDIFTWLDDCRAADIWITHEAMCADREPSKPAWRRHVTDHGYTAGGKAIAVFDQSLYGHEERSDLREAGLKRVISEINTEQTINKVMTTAGVEFVTDEYLRIELDVNNRSQRLTRKTTDDTELYVVVGLIVNNQVERAWLTRMQPDETPNDCATDTAPPEYPDDDATYEEAEEYDEAMSRHLALDEDMEVVEIPNRARQCVKWLADNAWSLALSKPTPTEKLVDPDRDGTNIAKEPAGNKPASTKRSPEQTTTPAPSAPDKSTEPETPQDPKPTPPDTQPRKTGPSPKNGPRYRVH